MTQIKCSKPYVHLLGKTNRKSVEMSILKMVKVKTREIIQKENLIMKIQRIWLRLKSNSKITKTHYKEWNIEPKELKLSLVS